MENQRMSIGTARNAAEARRETVTLAPEDVFAAAARIAGRLTTTPVLSSAALDERVGARTLVKAEVLQRTGSFKYRGAYNRLSQLTPEQRTAGVVAFSSGNHAQAVAAAARLLNMPAAIVMPSDAPAIKLANTRASGAEVVLYDRYAEDRVAIGQALASARAATLVPAFDDPDIIAGQGTLGLEFARQAQEQGVHLDLLLCPCGGGGLIAGVSLAFSACSPETRIYSVEPEAFDDTRRSLESGAVQRNAPGGRSICDALLAEEPGKLTFAINRRLLAGGLAVSDDEACAAVAYAARTLKLVVEPGGAVALAALLTGKIDVRGKSIGVVLTGGNIDAPLLADILRRYPD
jgi:threonine dehydratase